MSLIKTIQRTSAECDFGRVHSLVPLIEVQQQRRRLFSLSFPFLPANQSSVLLIAAIIIDSKINKFGMEEKRGRMARVVQERRRMGATAKCIDTVEDEVGEWATEAAASD